MTTPQRYCSDRCRREKPRSRPPGASSLENEIEMSFVRLLTQDQSANGDSGSSKGKIVNCSEVETLVFARSQDSEDAEAGATAREEGESSCDDSSSEDDDGGGALLPATNVIHGSNKLERVDERDPRKKGMQKARQREMVRQAARRGVAFGFSVDGEERRFVEAVQRGRVVESSFAKGEWGVRWR
ncbi:MAG: hypothetical protein Q9201_005215 [Fulgogasparrea decipioides]